jgi:hypothetical protein
MKTVASITRVAFTGFDIWPVKAAAQFGCCVKRNSKLFLLRARRGGHKGARKSVKKIPPHHF